ncbi:2-aminobenzoate-CoA ligase [Kordiimonas sediminis]|uniref:2-aminobenzoate-CoA ligase n=1 Tax=Kordiimonas sediminis TaxID=1735581 RepID=A0A919ALW5_9PROT|nr:AMP-binding protein [Kordiimonas sediminis]GHF13481.1 2-aminobenzoate-CoA ligase [Kordiimonas sediminis]
MGYTGHIDTFTKDRLPPKSEWPDLILDRPEFTYPERMNAGVELSDRMVEKGFGDHVALIGHGRTRTYKELTDWSNRIANVLVDDYGVVPGHRVLVRSPNTPAMVAVWLAVTKVGAVAVNTMPMLRAAELSKIVNKAEISLALCDKRLADELQACAATSDFLTDILCFDGEMGHDGDMDRMALTKSVRFEGVETAADDVALLGFTSGTTGEPKATMHFHRDLLIIADGYAQEVLGTTEEDVFIGSPPLAFTFGLGGLAIFPLRFGASAVLLEDATPLNLLKYIDAYNASICFTSPTAYKVMLQQPDATKSMASLRIAVSAGETLLPSVFDAWNAAMDAPILDGIGATEMLHIFISNRSDDARPGATGTCVSGYEAMIVDDNFEEVPRGTTGRLVVRGPTGCRYMQDDRQRKYVRDGWNITGDAFEQDEDGYFHFRARMDDMIVSSGYNIAGPEVEDAVLTHPAVLECAVIGCPDPERGQLVEAHVVLKDGQSGDDAMILDIQNHVKQSIAPYKYPRSVVFCDALPKTQTGKIQRFKLRAH